MFSSARRPFDIGSAAISPGNVVLSTTLMIVVPFDCSFTPSHNILLSNSWSLPVLKIIKINCVSVSVSIGRPLLLPGPLLPLLVLRHLPRHGGRQVLRGQRGQRPQVHLLLPPAPAITGRGAKEVRGRASYPRMCYILLSININFRYIKCKFQ